MPLDRSIPGALEVRRGDIRRFEQSAGGVFDNNFLIDVVGIGEATAIVDFSVRFVELPLVLTGWALAPGQRLLPGQYPDISGGVFTWKFGQNPTTGYPFYDGATLCINALNGPPGMIAQFNISFRGKALRNPAGR
jgi:hypothetical protein